MLNTEGVILCIIIGNVHQFIGHCLIPLDPCTVYLHKLAAFFLLLENCKQNFGEKKCKIVFFAAVLSISFFPLIVRELEVTSLM